MNEVTRILNDLGENDASAAEQLLPAVYEELRRLARYRMASESRDHTLQPTALVHEAWIRLVAPGHQNWENRAHFFSAAAEAMRRILVEHARRKLSQKRGGGVHAEELDEACGARRPHIVFSTGRCPNYLTKRGYECVYQGPRGMDAFMAVDRDTLRRSRELRGEDTE